MKYPNRSKMALWYYVVFILAMIMRFWDKQMIFQLGASPIKSPRIDPIVWWYQGTDLPDRILLSPLGIAMDILLILIPVLCIVRLFKKQQIRWLTCVHFLVFLVYVITIYTVPTLSIRKNLGLMFFPLLFIFSSHKRYAYVFEILRYYVAFIFTSASLWKIIRGTAFDMDHMVNVLKSHHIETIVHFPNHFISKLVVQLIENPTIAYMTFAIAVITQLGFSLAFFTKKFDFILGGLLVAFVLGDFLVMRIEYWEFFVFLPLFWWTKFSFFKTID